MQVEVVASWLGRRDGAIRIKTAFFLNFLAGLLTTMHKTLPRIAAVNNMLGCVQVFEPKFKWHRITDFILTSGAPK